MEITSETIQKQIQRHPEKLITKAKTHSVEVLDERVGRYKVISGGKIEDGKPKKEYIINVFQNGGASCNCDWATKRPTSLIENQGAVACSHTIAVFIYLAEGNRRRVSGFASKEQAVAQHRPAVDLVDGIVLTTRKLHYYQTSFFNLLKRGK